jgi:hypothetical protein
MFVFLKSNFIFKTNSLALTAAASFFYFFVLGTIKIKKNKKRYSEWQD